MAILLNNAGLDNDQWRDEFTRQLPDMPIYVYPETDRDQVKYAVVWEHPKGDLIKYKNLKAIFSLGAGMDHLLCDNNLPDIPLVPLLDPVVPEDMANYSLYWVINTHREFDVYRQLQLKKNWLATDYKPNIEFKVTVLGLGRIGQKIVDTINGAGYKVSAWDFKQKSLAPHLSQSVETYAGISELYQSINNADVVISCLAASDKTQGIINADFLSQMSSESTLINVSRGSVINEADLLDALDNDGINAAVLDVFCAEPLPLDNPFWDHPKVTITPHISGITYATRAASVIVNNINCMENGEMPEGVFDRNRYNR